MRLSIICTSIAVLSLAPFAQPAGTTHSRSRRHEALVLTYVQPPNDDVADDQWNGLRVMTHWLLHDSARCSCADVVVLVSKEVPLEKRIILEHDGALVIEASNPGVELKGGEDNWHFSWAKLVALELTQYERVIVMDIDMVVLDRVDSLFSWVDDHFVPSCGIGAVADIEWNPENPEGIFNAGVLLMFPSTTVLQEIISMTKSEAFRRSEHIVNDQNILNSYFQSGGRTWCKIPIRYHRFPSYRFPERNDTTTAETVVAHGAAWAGNLNPTLQRVWDMGLQAVQLRDELQQLMAELGHPLPTRSICGHCHTSGPANKRHRAAASGQRKMQADRKLLWRLLGRAGDPGSRATD